MEIIQISKEELKQLIKESLKEVIEEELIPKVKLSKEKIDELKEIEKEYYEGKFVKWEEMKKKISK